jgi:hypothetical protein
MRNKIVIGVMGVFLCCGGLAQAASVTIQISGNVTSLGGYTEAIPSSIYAGVTFTGTYTYDSSAIDSGSGHYTFDAPYGIDLSLGGYEFKTPLDHVGQFEINIANDDTTNGVMDYYSVLSGYPNISAPSIGFTINDISWILRDSTHSALASADLPTTAPILMDWDYNVLNIHGTYGPDRHGLSIYGTITQTMLIPEPLSAALMAIGVFFLRSRQ